MSGADLFALAGALSCLGDQLAYVPRADRHFGLIAGAILTDRACLELGGAPAFSER